MKGAKQALMDAIPSVETHNISQGQTVITNDKGLSILERLDEHQVRLDKLGSELHDTQSELRSVKRMVHDSREREYVTFCQNTDYRTCTAMHMIQPASERIEHWTRP